MNTQTVFEPTCNLCHTTIPRMKYKAKINDRWYCESCSKKIENKEVCPNCGRSLRKENKDENNKTT